MDAINHDDDDDDDNRLHIDVDAEDEEKGGVCKWCEKNTTFFKMHTPDGNAFCSER